MSSQRNARRQTTSPRASALDGMCLADLIKDPIVRMLVKRDKVSRNELMALIGLAQRYVDENA